MIQKLYNILTGWLKRAGLVKVTPAEEKLAELRMRKCKPCMHAEESKVLKLLNGSASYHKVLKCTLCKCPCWEKTIVVDEKCPVGKW